MGDVFNCKVCGICCQGEGGIYMELDAAPTAAALLDLTAEEFVDRYTEPKYGKLSLKTDEDGYCLLHDREKHICLIHEAKPRMCRDWPFFPNMFRVREAFEDAKNACPGIQPDATWEEFKSWFDAHGGTRPPESYLVFDKKR